MLEMVSFVSGAIPEVTVCEMRASQGWGGECRTADSRGLEGSRRLSHLHSPNRLISPGPSFRYKSG